MSWVSAISCYFRKFTHDVDYEKCPLLIHESILSPIEHLRIMSEHAFRVTNRETTIYQWNQW